MKSITSPAANAYYHFNDIESLTLTQSLDGERTPMFNVVLKPGATSYKETPAGILKDQYLYVFNGRYCYLQGEDRCDDRDEYMFVINEFTKYKAKQSKAAS